MDAPFTDLTMESSMTNSLDCRASLAMTVKGNMYRRRIAFTKPASHQWLRSPTGRRFHFLDGRYAPLPMPS